MLKKFFSFWLVFFLRKSELKYLGLKKTKFICLQYFFFQTLVLVNMITLIFFYTIVDPKGSSNLDSSCHPDICRSIRL